MRRGFTLIELLVAVVLLGIVVLGLTRFVGDFLHAETVSGVRLMATSVAQGRLELVRADPRYDSLGSLYGAGAGADTTGFPGYPTMRRVTLLARDRTGAPARDFYTLTVQVTHPAMRDTVSLTATIARP